MSTAATTKAPDVTLALSALERNSDSAQPFWRLLLIWGPTWVVFNLTFAVMIGFAALDAWLDTTRYHTLPFLVVTATIALLCTLATIFILFDFRRSITTRSLRVGSMLRAAAIVGDERLTPLVERQQTMPISLDLAVQPEELSPLARGSSARSTDTSLLRSSAVFLIILTSVSVNDSAMTLRFLWNDAEQAILLFGALLLAIGLVLSCLNVYWSLRPAASQMRVTVDARGIRWRASWLAGWRSIAWDEARAFARLSYPIPANSTGFPKEPFTTVYLLDAPRATLLWRAPYSEREATYQPAQRLILLVATNTALPLHDMTTLALALAQPKSDPAHALAVALADGGMTDVPPTLQALTRPARRTPGAYLLLAYLAFMSLALWALVGVVGYLNW